LIISPSITKKILKEKYSSPKIKSYQSKLNTTQKKSQKHNKSCLKGKYNVVYKFNENVLLGETDIKITKDSISLKGYSKDIKLKS